MVGHACITYIDMDVLILDALVHARYIILLFFFLRRFQETIICGGKAFFYIGHFLVRDISKSHKVNVRFDFFI